MRTIRKKCWPELFQAMMDGKKNFDLRLDDFEIAEGDKFVSEEWDPKTGRYTGRTIEHIVTYVGHFRTDNLFGKSEEEVKEKGIQILSLK